MSNKANEPQRDVMQIILENLEVAAGFSPDYVAANVRAATELLTEYPSRVAALESQLAAATQEKERLTATLAEQDELFNATAVLKNEAALLDRAEKAEAENAALRQQVEDAIDIDAYLSRHFCEMVSDILDSGRPLGEFNEPFKSLQERLLALTAARTEIAEKVKKKAVEMAAEQEGDWKGVDTARAEEARTIGWMISQMDVAAIAGEGESK